MLNVTLVPISADALDTVKEEARGIVSSVIVAEALIVS
jgi:hypothetical protein